MFHKIVEGTKHAPTLDMLVPMNSYATVRATMVGRH
jgi:hypothetical protein